MQRDCDALEASCYFHHLLFGYKLHFRCDQGEKGEGATITYTTQPSPSLFGKDSATYWQNAVALPGLILEIVALGNLCLLK
jgi:hypothetical protein